MPFINLNGTLTEVSQEAYDIWTVGQNQNQVGTVQTPAEAANAVAAAGGDVTTTPTSTETILTPNTTDNTPGQTLLVSNETVSTNTTADDPQAAARAGLTEEQLTLLGSADATDPYIRSRLGLPALSEVQTLSGAIGSTDFGNALGNLYSDVSTSLGNAVTSVSDYFSALTSNTTPSASEIETKPAEVVPGAATGSVAYGEDGELLPGYQLNETNDPVYVGGNADTPIQTTADTEVPDSSLPDLQQLVKDNLAANEVQTDTAVPDSSLPDLQQLVKDNLAANEVQTDAGTADADNYYQQFQTAFKEALDQPEPTDSPYAPVAATGDTPLVENAGTVTVEAAPAEFDTAQPIAVSPENYSPEELNTIADAQGVAGEQGFITSDTYNGQESLSPAELDAIANAQGVAGEEGFITSDTYNGQESLSPAELDAIAAAQGVAGEEGNITADSLAKDPGSYSAAELDAIAAAQGVDAGDTADGGITDQQLFDNEAAVSAQAAKDRAQKQATLTQQQGLNSSTQDWRVKLSLAKNADYLYNAKNAGILAPLGPKGTNGVVFPYTPTISTNYRADYSPYTLTHSNYKGYFYNSSYMDAINITATFTAQDTNEAKYLLAVIHFFRSVTKMFYGQDTQRGSPPPLVFLSGMGEYQFNRHPCVVSQFTYNLPADVDYIRASSIVNQDISWASTRANQSSPVPGLAGVSRLANALLPKGAKASPPAYTSLAKGNPSYVPTKMEMQITLLPVQSRNQVSKIFKLSEYASGNQLKGGFW